VASMWQVRDELWDLVAPLVPVHEPDPRGGRPRVDDRACFGAIVFVLFTGIAWQQASWAAPRRLRIAGSGSGRPRGLFAELHRELLQRLNAAG
jgi:transposase